ncbi:MAG: 16S rRNA (uracil(1498)-N(3))-methyltransferase [Azospirillaceae bacterium]
MTTRESDRLPRTRLHVGERLARNTPVTLGERAAHRLRTVLRLGPGDGVRLFSARDGEWLARLDRLDRQVVTAVPERRLRPPAAGTEELWLCFAPLKKDALDTLIAGATELGVTRFRPVITRHTDVARVNVERLTAQAVEAAEQCERLDVPVVDDPVPLAGLLADWPKTRGLVVLAEHGKVQPLTYFAATYGDLPIALLVGPEGGFAADELDELRALETAVTAGLGPRILRAETAALAALAIWQAVAGDGADRPPGR